MFRYSVLRRIFRQGRVGHGGQQDGCWGAVLHCHPCRGGRSALRRSRFVSVACRYCLFARLGILRLVFCGKNSVRQRLAVFARQPWYSRPQGRVGMFSSGFFSESGLRGYDGLRPSENLFFRRPWYYRMRCASAGRRCRTLFSRAGSSSAVITPSPSGSTARISPQGSIIMLWSKVRRLFSCRPPCPAAKT